MERKVSIVIPCRNERDFIGPCIKSILEADQAGCQVTVLVCDGLSDDGTRAIVEEIARTDARVVLVDNPHRTTPYALNIGLQARPFEVGIILGAHSVIDARFIRMNMEVLDADPTVGCAGGWISNEYLGDEARRIGAAMGHPFGVGSAHFRTGARHGYVDTVAFGAYRKEVFDRVGWFDEELARNQDDEFNFRVTSAGFKIFLDPRIKSKYYVRASFGKLGRQFDQYGYWKVYVNRKHRTVTTLRQVVPALLVLFLLSFILLFWLVPLLRLPLIAGLAIYLVAGWASARKARTVPGDTWGVMRAFITMHLAYGWGYLRGIRDFILLGRKPGESSMKLTR